MPELDPEKTGAQGEPPKQPATESPGGKPMGCIWIGAVVLYLVVVTVAVAHGLTVLWPPDGPEGGAMERLERLEEAVANGAEAEAPGAGDAQGGDPAPEPEPGSPPPPTPEARPVPSPPPPPPPPPQPTAEEGTAPAGSQVCRAGEQEAPYLFWTFCLFPEERLFVIVMLAGALGGLVHSLRSFYWYLGNRALNTSWAGMYVTLPVVGAAMAVVFYLVIRGGFTPSDSNFDQTNPFGFAALAVLVGMFTEQAALRLKEVAETVFTKGQKGKDHAGPPSVTQVEPDRGPVAGGTEVTLTGTGFKAGAVVRFGGKPATDVEVQDETTLVAKTPRGAAAGTVAVEVLNAGGQKASLPTGFTYE